MYSHSYTMPGNQVYRTNDSYSMQNPTYSYMGNEDERFFLAPFLFGGLAGTALGYGIANNNQINGNCCQGYYQPIYPYPYPITTSNNYYY